MPATATDRLYGLTTSVAVKPPVQISADVNVITFGEQTITTTTFTGTRTVTTVKGMRVLLTNQTNPIDNGIWEAMPATWRRAPDFDGARDAVNGTLVFSIYADCWQVEATDPIRIGYDQINFRSTYPFSPDANLFQRSLRVPEAFVRELPATNIRAGHLLAFDALGQPIMVLPESGSAADVLVELADPNKGAGLVAGAVKNVPFFTSLKNGNHFTIRLKGGVNVTPASGTVMTFIYTSEGLWREVSRNF